MPCLLIEHFADGRVRAIERGDGAPEPAERFAPLVVQSLPPSIDPTRWFAAHVGCLACGQGWAAVGPEDTPLDALECARCGERRSAPVEDEWCSGCGVSRKVIREPGCPSAGIQCAYCGEMKAMVA